MTREKSRYLLLEMMDELLSILETQDDFVFLLDGQTIVLEDYLDIRPEKEEAITDFIKSGRLFIGPWYVLPDEFLISGESHIRNYLVGKKICDRFGGGIDTGYLPDSFGHPSQMPQILKGLGMDEMIFWRGLGPDITRTEFIWEGKDGTEILGINTPFSYGVAACMPEDSEEFVERLKLKIDMLSPLTDGKVLLMMNGVDHVAPQGKFLENLEYARSRFPEFELRQTGFSEYLDAVKGQNLHLERTKGELRSGYRAYLLGGTLSTRMYLKQMHRSTEVLLEKYAEPLASIASISFGAEYPAAELLHAWKLFLSNTPHDSICGCGIDEIHDEMTLRYRSLEDFAGGILESAEAEVLRRMGREISHHDGSFTVFNPLLHERRDVVHMSLYVNEKLLRKVNYETGNLDEYLPQEQWREPSGIVVFDTEGNETEGIIHRVTDEDTMHLSLRTQPEMFRGKRIDFSFVAERLPSVGLSSFTYRLTYDPEERLPSAGQKIENDLFSVEWDHSSLSLTVTDKRSGSIYTGLHIFEDGGDAGDEYTYSAPLHDRLYSLDKSTVAVSAGGSSSFPRMTIRGTLRIPSEISSGRSGRSEELVAEEVETLVSLYPGIPRIDFRTTVRNAAKDHRLRVLFPAGMAVSQASSEGLFSVDDRPVTPRDLSSYEDWIEPPSTNPQKTFVRVGNSEKGLAVANRGLPEYEVFQDESGGSVMAVTLLRCVGWLSLPDLRARKGNGGWTLETPGAQCLGDHVFEYSLIPHNGPWEEEGIAAAAHEFNVPPLAFKGGEEGRIAGGTYSLVQVDRPEILISALKKAEEGEGYILRCYNSSSRNVSASFRFGCRVKSLYITDLAEKRRKLLEDRGGEYSVEFDPWRIVTVEIEMEKAV